MKNTEKLYKKLGVLSNGVNHRMADGDYQKKYLKSDFGEECLDFILEYKDKKVSDFFTEKGLKRYENCKNYLEAKLVEEKDNSLSIMDDTLLRILNFKLLSFQKEEILEHIKVLKDRLLEKGRERKIDTDSYSVEFNQLLNLPFEEVKQAIEFLSKNQALKLFQPVKNNNGVVEVEIKRIKKHINRLQYYKFN